MREILGEMRFSISDVLNWKFGPVHETLRSALVDTAWDKLNIPQWQRAEYADKWTGEVTIEEDQFLVSIYTEE